MRSDNTTRVDPARRSAWPRVFGIVLSCAVAAVALESTTAAYARMGENAVTTILELTPDDDTVSHQRFCTLGNACGDDTIVSGNFGGVWRDGAFVEPDPRTFPGIRFIGKVISAAQGAQGEDAFDVYCSTEGGDEACVEITFSGGSSDSSCKGIIEVESDMSCSDFDYKLEYPKEEPTVLKTCKSNVVATCLANDSALVTNGHITAYRALFDYDCVRYCGGGCCRF